MMIAYGSDILVSLRRIVSESLHPQKHRIIHIKYEVTAYL